MQESTEKESPLTSTEVADRVLGALERAADKTGSEVARVWPQMVRARQAEAISSIASSVVLPLVVICVAAFTLRMAGPKANWNEGEENTFTWLSIGAAALLLISFVGFLFVLLGGGFSKDIAAAIAPEGQYVREIVQEALGK